MNISDSSPLKIILLGYMGSGKSTIGKLLSASLNIPFFDLDELIEKTENQTISEIFKSKGEIYFRKRETEILQTQLNNADSFVLSLGGGTPCYGVNMDLIRDSGAESFYLNVSIPELTRRLQKEQEKRPLIADLSKDELPEFIGKHLFERNPFYQKAKHTVAPVHATAEEIVKIISQMILT